MNPSFYQNLFQLTQTQLQQIYQSAFYIALSSTIYFLIFGGLLNISYMIGQILKDNFQQSSRTKLTLISGLVFFSALVKTFYNQHLTEFSPFDSLKYTESTSPLRLIIAGLCVGFGSQYAMKGCSPTFGFGQIAFPSLKSIVSHMILVVSCCLTHTYKLHSYIPQTPRILILSLPFNISYTAYLLVFLLIPFLCFIISKEKSLKSLIQYMLLFAIGILYAYGLMLGGFSQRKLVFNYFYLDQKWNPLFVGIAIIVFGANFVAFLLRKYMLKMPLFGTQKTHDQTKFTLNVIIGSVLFGFGWGLAGITPASILLLMPLQSIKIVFYWGISCLIGMKTAHKLFQEKVIVPQVQKNQ